MNIRATKKNNSNRKYPGVGGCRHSPVNIADKRAEAKERQEAWDRLSPAEKLAALDRRLGKGQGAAKQRARLQAQLAKAGEAQAAAGEAPARAKVKPKAKERRAQERAG